MARVLIDGYFDSLHHEPFTPTVFHAFDLRTPVTFGTWSFSSIFVHDTRHPNGTAPSDNAVAQVLHELDGLRTDNASVTSLILQEPDGLPGRLHSAGGGYASGRVVFYVARTKMGDMCLCANIY